MATNSHPDDVYILSVHLIKSTNPVISRILYVSADLKFDVFHLVLQAAFGWANYHPYTFTVSEPSTPGQHNKDLLVISTTDEGWENEDRCAVPRALALERTLASVFGNPQFADTTAEVVYKYGDLNDGWGHQITYLGKGDGESAKRQLGKGIVSGQMTWCVAGEGHPCAEDCGGSGGWEQLKQAFGRGWSLNEIDEVSSAELRSWYATDCLNGEREILNPWGWDIVQVNKKLARLYC